MGCDTDIDMYISIFTKCYSQIIEVFNYIKLCPFKWKKSIICTSTKYYNFTSK